MLAELLETALVHIVEHARGAACDLTALAHAFDFAFPRGIGLAPHEVVIVCFAAGTDEERGTEEWSGGAANFGDAGDGRGKRGGVDQDLLVEAIYRSVRLPFLLSGALRCKFEGEGHTAVVSPT